ncbi:hypothetical protein BJY01DRAFT_242008 [Aspergillus pseudoustus]|uniref:Uncharacterized protein n=1 Tax=Aspergillus pseudoustus TaxID=1810923 RepID=A0ABR4L070_9EURO
MPRYTTILLGFCGTIIAAPTQRPRTIPPWPFIPFPGEGAGEPALPLPSEFPSELQNLPPFPFPEMCGESPGTLLSELENVPWEQLSTEEGGESLLPLMEGEDIGQEEETEIMS